MRRAWLIIDGAAYRLLIMICQKKGERILFFCQEDDGSYRLYLMMVVAADEECYPFVKGKHEIIMKDDCCSWGPEQRLAKAATLRIKEILGIDD